MHWPSYEHTQGSYTCYRPGQWSFWGSEGLREGNLHFCGEHTSADFQGWMEGGAETGAMVAAEILDDLGLDYPAQLQALMSIKGALPQGRLWDAYRTNLAVDSAMLRTVVMPPGVPQAAADALRTALARLNDDKDYAEEAMKSIQFVPHYETGADINARVRRALTVPPEIRTFVLDYMKGGGK